MVRPRWLCTSLAEAQKQGGEVAFIDVEHALDPTYAEALGVDINNLLVSQPDTGEQGRWRSAKHWCAPEAVGAIVVDSRCRHGAEG